MRRGNGMEVAVKMQIDFLAGLNLRLSSTRSAAFHAKHRTERRLARSDNDFFANARQTLSKPDGGHSLPFTGGCGRGSRHQDELASARKCRITKDIQLQLGAVASNGFKIFVGQVQLFSDGLNWQHWLIR